MNGPLPELVSRTKVAGERNFDPAVQYEILRKSYRLYLADLKEGVRSHSQKSRAPESGDEDSALEKLAAFLTQLTRKQRAH